MSGHCDFAAAASKTMSDVKCAQALLEAAEQDINALRALRDAAGVGDGVFGFHVQQAAEKSFKAWLALLGVKFPLTHDLGGLTALLDEKVDATAFHPLNAYTPFGVQFRYQALEADTPIDRLAALRQVEALWRRVTTERKRLAR